MAFSRYCLDREEDIPDPFGIPGSYKTVSGKLKEGIQALVGKLQLNYTERGLLMSNKSDSAGIRSRRLFLKEELRRYLRMDTSWKTTALLQMSQRIIPIMPKAARAVAARKFQLGILIAAPASAWLLLPTKSLVSGLLAAKTVFLPALPGSTTTPIFYPGSQGDIPVLIL